MGPLLTPQPYRHLADLASNLMQLRYRDPWTTDRNVVWAPLENVEVAPGSGFCSPPGVGANRDISLRRPRRAVRTAMRRVAGGDGPQDSLPLARQARRQQEGRRSGQRADRHARALGGRRRRRRRAGRRGRPATHRALPAPSAKGVDREISAQRSRACGGRPASPQMGRVLGPSQSARPKCGYRGPGGGIPIPVIAQMICHTCGLRSEAAPSSHGPSATPCPCGGIRQVVRIVRHSPDAASASSQALERNVQERADDETRNPLNAARADRGARRRG
jgi:hypothetical protein